MARCEVCGNEYDKPLEIHQNGEFRVFDCFECAIQALAPVCTHCHCKVIGHGVQAGSQIYCCANCARAAGISTISDRIHSTPSGLSFAGEIPED